MNPEDYPVESMARGPQTAGEYIHVPFGTALPTFSEDPP
jgi:hypothetical protein